MPLNIDWQQILLHILNFVILFAILYFILYKPVTEFMKKRESYYKDLDDKANKELNDAEQMKKDYEVRLSGVNSEIDIIREQAIRKANETGKQIVDNAYSEADKIIAHAKQKAKYDADKIIHDAETHVKQLVELGTEKVILDSTASQSFDQFLDAAQRGEAE